MMIVAMVMTNKSNDNNNNIDSNPLIPYSYEK